MVREVAGGADVDGVDWLQKFPCTREEAVAAGGEEAMLAVAGGNNAVVAGLVRFGNLPPRHSSTRNRSRILFDRRQLFMLQNQNYMYTYI